MSEMAKFRKKPVIIEAIEWDETQATLAILENLGMMAARHSGHRDKPDLCQYLGIATLEGVMSANKGDWIIRGIKGEFYPCKPDIFAASYESAFSIWRAALEDRQEAAPGFATVGQSDIALASGAFRDGCVLSGVPSEATPSKENAPPEWPTLPPPDPFDAGFQVGLELGKYQAASAEVPTPPKPLLFCNLCGMRRDEHIDTDHRFLDGRTAPAPEGVQGTPKKETPPISDNPSGMYCQDCRAVGMYHCSDPVNCGDMKPMGVQGKEPQKPTTLSEFIEYAQLDTLTFDNEDEAADLMTATWIAAHAAGKVSGEAAGRRSAITEIQEWILTVREDPFDLWSAGYNKGFDAVSKKCAELQEKTK